MFKYIAKITIDQFNVKSDKAMESIINSAEIREDKELTFVTHDVDDIANLAKENVLSLLAASITILIGASALIALIYKIAGGEFNTSIFTDVTYLYHKIIFSLLIALAYFSFFIYKSLKISSVYAFGSTGFYKNSLNSNNPLWQSYETLKNAKLIKSRDGETISIVANGKSEITLTSYNHSHRFLKKLMDEMNSRIAVN